MKKNFIKMHGLGNDFAVFDAMEAGLTLTGTQIRKIGDRHTGIGFDQMVIIDPPQTPGTDAFLRIFNADGSEVGACGNATRCVSKYLMEKLSRNDRIVLQTKAGILTGAAADKGICVDMGDVKTGWQDIPLSREESTLSIPLMMGLEDPVGVNIGNPHAVFFVPKVADIPIADIGPRVENNPLFPERTNVEFAEVISRTKIRMRVWERGTGITMACGTGACATAVAGVRRKLTERKVTIQLDGGDLDIEWRESDNHVLMTGAVAEVFRGEIEL